jgi:hypothetical protein
MASRPCLRLGRVLTRFRPGGPFGSRPPIGCDLTARRSFPVHVEVSRTPSVC